MSEHLLGKDHLLVGIEDAELRARVAEALEQAAPALARSAKGGRKTDVRVVLGGASDLPEQAAEICRRGGTLLAAVVDPSLRTGEGRSLPRALRDLRPAIRIVGLEDGNDGIPPIGVAVDRFVSPSVPMEQLVARLRSLLALEGRPVPVLRLDETRVIKLVETPFEREAWFRLRYEVYVAEQEIIPLDRLREEERSRQLEFEPCDFLETTRHVVCMDYSAGTGRCIAGARVLGGTLPIETLVDLSELRARRGAAALAELSRYIIAPPFRGRFDLVVELSRMVAEVSRDRPVKLCTTNNARTERLYRLMGFRPLLRAPISSDEYRLTGSWLPMVADLDAIEASIHDGSVSDQYPDCSPEFFAVLTRRVLGEHDRLPLRREQVFLFVPLRRRRAPTPAPDRVPRSAREAVPPSSPTVQGEETAR